MKKGYRIEIDKSLSEKELESAKEYADAWIKDVNSNNGMYNDRAGGGQSSRAFWRRGIFGFHFNHRNVADGKERAMTFRRKITTKRVFIITLAENLVDKVTNKSVNLKNCICAYHLGGTKVKFKKTPDTFTYYETGEIKG